MKRQVVLAASVATVALIGGAAFLMFAGESKPETLASYWDGKVELNKPDNAGTLPIIKAVEAKDIAVADYLLKAGANVEVKNRDGVSAVMAAAKAGDKALFDKVAAAAKAGFGDKKLLSFAIDGGNADIVKAVLDKGGDANAELLFKGKKKPHETPDYKDPRVITPLRKAVYDGNAAVVRVLLDKGAEGAEFFLSEVVQKAKPDMVKALAEKSGKLHNVAVKGMDLLMYAASTAAPETLEFLIDENAGNIDNAFRRVLLHRKADNQYRETVDLFMKKGATPTVEAMEIALKKKQFDVYKSIAGCSVEANPKTSNGESMLMFMIKNGNLDGVKVLVEKGADMWVREEDGSLPIEEAVKLYKKYPEVIGYLESKLKDKDETGYDGETLLMLYAANGNAAAFLPAADGGANIFKADDKGKNMLMYAAEGGNTDIMDYLLLKGLKLNGRDNAGRTALMYAVSSGQNGAFTYLNNKNVKLVDADHDGKTVLMYAAEKAGKEVVGTIINNGESAATADRDGKTALMYAAENENLAALDKILETGVDVNATDNDGKTALSYAAMKDKNEAVKMLRQFGADIYAADKNAAYPVVFAIKNNNAKGVELLSDHFMSFNRHTTDNNKTYLMYAAESANPDIIRIAAGREMNMINKKDRDGKTALMYLMNKGRPDMVREFLRQGGNVTSRDNNGKTVLMYAAESVVGVNMVTVLRELGSKLDSTLRTKDNTGKTALMYAVIGENAQIVKMHMLLQYGADPDVSDNGGKTVLMHLLDNHDRKIEPQMVDELVKALKGGVEQSDNEGKTALMYAAANPMAGLEVIDILLENKADINAVDKTGKSVLMYAVEGGNIGKVRQLIEAGAKKDVQTTDGKSYKDYAIGTCFTSALSSL